MADSNGQSHAVAAPVVTGTSIGHKSAYRHVQRPHRWCQAYVQWLREWLQPCAVAAGMVAGNAPGWKCRWMGNTCAIVQQHLATKLNRCFSSSSSDISSQRHAPLTDPGRRHASWPGPALHGEGWPCHLPFFPG